MCASDTGTSNRAGFAAGREKASYSDHGHWRVTVGVWRAQLPLSPFGINLFRTDTSKRKVGIPTKRILAASSDSYREALLGLGEI